MENSLALDAPYGENGLRNNRASTPGENEGKAKRTVVPFRNKEKLTAKMYQVLKLLHNVITETCFSWVSEERKKSD